MGGNTHQSPDPDRLINVDNTIEGSGSITGDLTNEAGGTLNANVSGATLYLQSQTGGINLGLMEASNGGTLFINGAFTNDGLIEASSIGSIFIGSSEILGSGTLAIAQGSHLQLSGAVDGGTLQFLANPLGLSESVEIDDFATFNGSQHQDFNAVVAGFSIGDVLAVKGFGSFGTLDGIGTPIFNTGTGYSSLTLLDGGQTVGSVLLVGDYSADTFNIAADPTISGAIDLTVSCFCRGTLIRTEHGEVPVENLAIGDKVFTIPGSLSPISWIGRKKIATRFIDPLRAWPIRIRAGALHENMPSRDLRLSPDHAILVGEVLIQAGALVNGTSIMRETKVPQTFTYYHVELDDHSLLLAENTPAETFVDNVDRLGFDNWEEHEALYPDGKPIVEMPYPRAKAHRQVPRAIRELLIERAAVLMSETTVVAA